MPSTTTEPKPGRYYKRGDSIRGITEFDPNDPTTRVQVIYALYRRRDLWNPLKRVFEPVWCLSRQGYCSYETFKRWAKKAELMKEGEELV